MAQARRKKEKKEEPVVPQLAPAEVRRRSETHFNGAMAGIFVPKAANIHSEVADYLKILEAKLKGLAPTEANAERAYNSARAEYMKKYPTSTLTYLLGQTDGDGAPVFEFNPQFDFTESGGKISGVEFDRRHVASFEKEAKAAATTVEAAFTKFKKLVVDRMVKAAEPIETGKYSYQFVEKPNFLTEAEFKKFCSRLTTAVKKAPPVPIKVAFETELTRIKMEYGGKRKVGTIEAG